VDPAARTTVGDVELRPWQLRDAEAALQMLTGDEQITRWYVEIAPEMSIDEERRFIAEAARAWQEDHLPVLAIVDAAGGGLLGSCGAQRSRFAGVAALRRLRAADSARELVVHPHRRALRLRPQRRDPLVLHPRPVRRSARGLASHPIALTVPPWPRW
jgi:hypothetical protein